MNIINPSINITQSLMPEHNTKPNNKENSQPSINAPINRAFGRELTNCNIKSDNSIDAGKIQNTRNPGIQVTKSLSLPVGSKGSILVQNENAPTRTHDNPNYKEGKLISQKGVDSGRVGKTSDRDEIDSDEMDPIDKQNYANIQYVVPYLKTIFEHLRATETKYIPKPDYIKKVQQDINEKMRGILIDWIVDVHLKFKLLPETLFLTVNLIDRYLGVAEIQRQKLQLVGVSAMLIAAKYEEIYPPEVKEFEFVTDRAYTKAEILDMEGKILSSLQFNLTSTSSFRFLERYGILAGFDEKSFHLARYLLELSLVEYKMLKYIPSEIASTAVYLVNKIFKREGWPENLIKQTKYSESQIRPCAKELCLLLQNATKTSLQAVKKKFSTMKFSEVAKIHLDKM